MEMFLILAVLSLVGIVVSALLFSTAIERSEQYQRERALTVAPPLAAPQFFAAAEEAIAANQARRRPGDPVDIDALLLQIARHVQLEQAAAESFLHSPTLKSLNSPTTSTLLN